MSKAIRFLLKIPKPSKMADSGSNTKDIDIDAIIAGWTDEKIAAAGLTKENLKAKILEAMKISEIVNESLDVPVVPVETFQDRCKSLGALSRKFVIKLGEAKAYLNEDQYVPIILDPDHEDYDPDAQPAQIVAMNHADRLIRDCEAAYALLETKRIWCESLLSEEQLEEREDYLGPRLAELNAVRHLYGVRLEYEASQKAAAEDNESIADQSSAIDNLAQTMSTLLGTNYELKNHVSFKFSGQLITYPGWKEQVTLGMEEMKRLKKPTMTRKTKPAR